MAADTNFPVTVEGKRLLEEELKRLVGHERPAVVQAIEEARAMGDLKENAEYAAAKERQSFLEGRIQYLNVMVTGAQVIDPKGLHYEYVVFGATVTLEESDSGNKIKYKIVGVDEADIVNGKISIAAPIARALIKKKVGEEVQVKTPKGNVSYEVCKIEYV